MNIVEQLKADLKTAMKEGDSICKEILRVILGDIASLEMSSQQNGKPVSEDQVFGVMRKILAGNAETIASHAIEEKRKILEKENEIINKYLPAMPSVEKIVDQLQAVAEEIKESNEGKAMGVAMKHLKSIDFKALGEDVKKAVQAIRA